MRVSSLVSLFLSASCIPVSPAAPPARPALQVAIALSIVASSCTGQEAERTVAKPAAPLSIASYNVLYALGEKTADNEPTSWVDGPTLAQLKELDVDLLLLQETNEAWEAAIRESLAERLPHCAFHQPGRHKPGGLGVCAKQPIVADEAIESPLGWFPAQRVVIETSAGKVQVLNVHLRPALSKSGQSWWDANAETRAPRVQEMREYLGRIAADLPTIIGGDFNEVGGAPLFDVLSKAGFDNAFTVAEVTTSTWRWLERPSELNAQLDHVAYTRTAFRVAEAKVALGGNSDHLPVVVKLERASE